MDSQNQVVNETSDKFLRFQKLELFLNNKEINNIKDIYIKSIKEIKMETI